MAKKKTSKPGVESSNVNVESKKEETKTVDNSFNSKKSDKATVKKVKVKGLRRINLGKLEPHGEMLLFHEGEIKELDYRSPYAEALDRAHEHGFVEILDK